MDLKRNSGGEEANLKSWLHLFEFRLKNELAPQFAVASMDHIACVFASEVKAER